MHPYRQTAPHPHHPHAQTPEKNHFQKEKRHPSSKPTTSTLSSLFHQHSHSKNIHISCNKKLNVIVQKLAGRRPSLLSDRKKKRKVGIVVGGASRATLQACLQKFAAMNDQYILTAHPHHNYEQWLPHPRGKVISIKSRSSSQTSLGGYFSNKKRPQNTNSNVHIDRPVTNPGGRKMVPEFASGEKGIEEMFVVEQNPGESMQSQRESLPRQPMGQLPFNFQNIRKPPIKSDFNTIAAKYIQKTTNNQAAGEAQPKPHPPLPQTHIQDQNQKENVGEKSNHGPYVSAPSHTHQIENPKFSFAEAAMRGLFPSEGAIPPKESGFKVAEMQQSQEKKELIRSKGMSSMSDLSSIAASNLREGKNMLEIDSIRNELDKINSCLPIASKASKVAEEPFIEIKINNQQGNLGDVVQIQEKPLEANRSEYFVRYNLKENKGTTDVIRVSPLKFRRKEEVVRQFVKARIVSKESDSINIP